MPKVECKYILLILVFFCTSNVLKAIEEAPNFIRVCHAMPSNTLIWQNPEDICGTFEKLIIYHRATTGGNFIPIDTIRDLNVSEYEHSDNHQPNSSYFIAAYYDCLGNDGYYSDTIVADHEHPEQVEIDSISYWDGSWIMGWTPTDHDIMGYIIYLVEGGHNHAVDTIYGRENSNWTVSEDRNIGKEEYRIAAFDSCRNRTPLSMPHINIELSSSVSRCDRSVTLEWSPYEGWQSEVDTYQIMLSSTGRYSSDYVIYENITSNERSLTIEDLEENMEYCFYIRAVSSGEEKRVTASSNRVCIETDFVRSTEHLYLQSVTVEEGVNEIQFRVSNDGDVSHFNLLKGTDTTHFRKIADIQYNNNRQQYNYTDANVNTRDTVYYYKIELVDICDKPRQLSNPGSNILLKGETEEGEDETGRQLIWSSYLKWEQGVQYYRVMRSNTMNEPFIWDNIADIGGSGNDYMDTIIFEEVGNDGICYYIVARENGSDPFGERNVSKSNEYCFVESPRIFIPNAFAPDGVNTEFTPKGQYIDFERSDMLIFNRWGTKVYQTDDIRKGWNGLNDDKVPLDAGTYIYIITIYGLNDTREVHEGSITLIR